MKAISYLIFTTLKNRFKLLARTPLKLVFVIIFSVIIIGSLIAAMIIPIVNENIRNMREIYLMAFSLFIFFFFATAFNGLKAGATFFTMPDINLLFTAPIKPKTILQYGLVRQMSSSLFVGIFLIFQFFWMRTQYKLNFNGFLALLISYSLVLFLSQLCSMTIYSYTSFHEKRRTIIKTILYILLLSIFLYAGYLLYRYYPNLNAIVENFNVHFFTIIPIAGWLVYACVGIIEGKILYVVIGLILTLLFSTFLIVFINKLKTDYYEDVLQTTENIHSIVLAQKEGKIVEAIPRKVKLGDVGINKGKGASAIYYKHVKESKRKRIFILDSVQISLLIMTTFSAFFTRKEGVFPVHLFSIYLSFFTITLGSWIRELNFHYIFLIPISPFRKLIALLLESFKRIIVYTITQYLIIFVIIQAPILDVILYALGYISFQFLFTAITILVNRILGQANKVLLRFFYIFTIIFLIIPGIALGVIINGLFENLVFINLGCLLWNTFISLVIIFACRNMLDVAEIKN